MRGGLWLVAGGGGGGVVGGVVAGGVRCEVEGGWLAGGWCG